jgi:hypothetical protein
VASHRVRYWTSFLSHFHQRFIISGSKKIEKLESRINSDLASMNEWLNANRLSLNTIKTEYMLIGSAPRINRLTAEPILDPVHTIPAWNSAGRIPYRFQLFTRYRQNTIPFRCCVHTIPVQCRIRVRHYC